MLVLATYKTLENFWPQDVIDLFAALVSQTFLGRCLYAVQEL